MDVIEACERAKVTRKRLEEAEAARWRAMDEVNAARRAHELAEADVDAAVKWMEEHPLPDWVVDGTLPPNARGNRRKDRVAGFASG